MQVPTAVVRSPDDGFRMSQFNERMVNKDVEDLKFAVIELQKIVTQLVERLPKGS